MNKGCRPDPKTMPVTKEYAEGHERVFGEGTERRPGRYVWDPEQKMLVPAGETKADMAAYHVFTDRHHENTCTTEGIDIGSRRKRREYMRATGAAECDDYKPDYGDRVKAAADRKETREIHESVERTVHKLYKP